MNASLEPAHSPIGGSVAARVIRCPASVSFSCSEHARPLLDLAYGQLAAGDPAS